MNRPSGKFGRQPKWICTKSKSFSTCLFKGVSNNAFVPFNLTLSYYKFVDTTTKCRQLLIPNAHCSFYTRQTIAANSLVVVVHFYCWCHLNFNQINWKNQTESAFLALIVAGPTRLANGVAQCWQSRPLALFYVSVIICFVQTVSYNFVFEKFKTNKTEA
jgi:hypothetical protein